MSHDQQYYVGHNKFYEQVCNLRFVTKQVFISCLFHLQVLVAKDPSLLGKMFDVVITETGKHYLKGDVLKESLAVVPARPAPLPFGAVSGMKTFKNQRTTSQEESSSTSQGWLTVGDVILVCLTFIVICVIVFVRYSQLISLFT